MKRRQSSATLALKALVALGLMVLAAATTACSENPVGRQCFIGGPDGGASQSQAVVASPALECQSRTCLHVPQQTLTLPEGSEYADLCTAECATDEDCDRVPESPCVTGFTCAVPVVVGPFCCRKLCVCKDYLVLPDGGAGLPVPAACDSDNQANTCCNLPGRGDLPQCQSL